MKKKALQDLNLSRVKKSENSLSDPKFTIKTLWRTSASG